MASDSQPDLLTFMLSRPEFRKPRLPSLYSDFRRLQTTNPNGYHANVTAWKTVLSDATSAGIISPNHLVFASSHGLLSELATQEWGRPLGLGAVINEAVQAREFYPLDEFLRRKDSIYHWTYLGAAVGWGLGKIGLGGASPVKTGKGGVVEGRFVVIRNVEEEAKTVIAAVSKKATRAERLYTHELFIKELMQGMTQDDLKVLLKYMSRDIGEIAYDGTTIKFKQPHEPLTPINEQDISIAQLRSLLSTLNLRVDKLSADIATCNIRARSAVSSKNTAVAKAALRSRKIAERALDTQLSSLGQVEEVMASIEQASSNIELVQTLDRSSKVLQHLNKEIGGTEKVDAIMDRLKDETDRVGEITQILNEGADVVDEEEVDDELATMLAEEQQKKVDSSERAKDEERLAKTLQRLSIEEDIGRQTQQHPAAVKDDATETMTVEEQQQRQREAEHQILA